jgi:hypothetical protein
VKSLVMDPLSLDRLRGALAAEDIVVDEEALLRAFRRLANPAGCERCGAVTKVGTFDNRGVLKLNCCGSRRKK